MNVSGKYVHERWGEEKVFYVSNAWSGNNIVMKEYNKGCFRTKIELNSSEWKTMQQRLQDNGWKQDEKHVR